MNEAANESVSGLAGKIVKNRPLSEPIRLQDLEDSARSQAWKKIKKHILIDVLPRKLEQNGRSFSLLITSVL